jgi:hypothetical protein
MKTDKRKRTMTPPVIQQPVVGQRRAMLNRIRARAKAYGFEIDKVRPIRYLLYHKLRNNPPSVVFNVAQEQSTYPLEIRLEKSDAAWIDRIGLAIHKVLIDSGSEIPANSPRIHYPDPNWLALPNEARDLEGLYNSQLFIKTDQTIRQERYDTSQFRCVPQQQYQPSATDPLWWETSKDCLVDVETNFGIWGNKRNELEIKLGEGSYSAIAGNGTTHNNYAVLMLEGFELVRGAESITVSDMNVLFENI